MLNIPALEKLVHELSRLPGIGHKSAQRLAYHILRSPNEQSLQLRDALHQVEEQVQTCRVCYNYSENEICRYCDDDQRSDHLLCVVEEPMDIMRIESSGVFRGRYHVLQGAISPLDGVNAADLKLEELFTRIKDSQATKDPVQEVVLALDADLEGDTTALFIKRELESLNTDIPIKLTRIAHGVPFGSDIDYIDQRTLGWALDHRVEL